MGRRGGRGKKTHQLDDQYGAIQKSDDDDARARANFAGGGSRQAGAGVASTKIELEFRRRDGVPKFLQERAHLLIGGTKSNDNHVSEGNNENECSAFDRSTAKNGVVDDDGDDGPDDDDERKGVVLSKEDIEAKCLELKGKGNRCFQDEDYEAAVLFFTNCLELSAGASEEVYYSNRSAAFAKMERFREAKEDAEKAIECKPGWAKAWMRLAIAVSDSDLSLCAKAYERASRLDPLNEDLKASAIKARKRETEAIDKGLFKFKASNSNKKLNNINEEEGLKKKRKSRTDGNTKEKKKNKKQLNTLSFNEDDAEEH